MACTRVTPSEDDSVIRAYRRRHAAPLLKRAEAWHARQNPKGSQAVSTSGRPFPRLPAAERTKRRIRGNTVWRVLRGMRSGGTRLSRSHAKLRFAEPRPRPSATRACHASTTTLALRTNTDAWASAQKFMQRSCASPDHASPWPPPDLLPPAGYDGRWRCISCACCVPPRTIRDSMMGSRIRSVCVRALRGNIKRAVSATEASPIV